MKNKENNPINQKAKRSAMRHKPKVLLDIKPTRATDLFAGRNRRVNLNYKSGPSKKIPKYLPQFFAVLILISVFAGNLALAPSGGDILAQTNNEERAKLEAELADLENQITEYEGTIAEYQQQGKSLEGEISVLQAKIDKIALQIRAINLSLSQLNGEINETTSRIGDVESEIEVNRAALATLIRKVNEEDQRGLIEVILTNPNLSDFFGSVNDLLLLQDNLNSSIEHLGELRGDLINQKELLAMERTDVEALRIYQIQQQGDVKTAQDEKDYLLKVTKGKESEFQKLLVETEKSAAEIRARIFRLLGGGEMSFEQAYEFARFAEKATGVRAALILAVLDRESALGSNVGKCQYNVNPYYPDRASNKTTMHPIRDIPHFLKITDELNLDPESTLVSCPIPSDGAYGGAMGPAQFIPSTWVLYEDAVAKVTGSNPSSPWRNSDAFVATGLLLKDNGAASNELAAAARYYCGGRWQRYVCTNVYGRNVIDTATRFQRDINVLEG